MEGEGIDAIIIDLLIVVALRFPVLFCSPALMAGVGPVVAMVALMSHNLVQLHEVFLNTVNLNHQIASSRLVLFAAVRLQPLESCPDKLSNGVEVFLLGDSSEVVG